MPLDWSTTQRNLGIALLRLGERESGTAKLKLAVDAFREALKEYTRERGPLQWAMTQDNLAAALHILGERDKGTEQLKEAVSALESTRVVYKEAGMLQYQNHLEARLKSLRNLILQRSAH